jgi:hypothetical protein
LRDKNEWLELEPEKVNIKTGGMLKSMGTMGMKMGDVNGHIAGKASKLKIVLPATFLVSLPEGAALVDLQLLRLRTNNDNRGFHMAGGGYMHIQTGPGKDAIGFSSKKIAPQVYEVSLPPGTSSGEYGIIAFSPDKIYTFSIGQ